MGACLLVIAAGIAAAALLLPLPRDRGATAGSRGPRPFVLRVLRTTALAAAIVPAGIVAVLVVVRPPDAPLRFVHGSTVLGFWIAATVLGACSMSRADPWASPRRAGTAAVGALVAASAAVALTPYDRFASALPGPAVLLAAAAAVLLIATAGAATARCLRAWQPVPGRAPGGVLGPLARPD